MFSILLILKIVWHKVCIIHPTNNFTYLKDSTSSSWTEWTGMCCKRGFYFTMFSILLILKIVWHKVCIIHPTNNFTYLKDSTSSSWTERTGMCCKRGFYFTMFSILLILKIVWYRVCIIHPTNNFKYLERQHLFLLNWMDRYVLQKRVFSQCFQYHLTQDWVVKGLTHSHTMTPFDAPGKQAFWKHCGKRRNCS